MEQPLKQIRQTIATFICDELSVDIEEIDPEMNLGAYGLGSAAAVTLIGILEDTYELTLSPVLIFDYPSIDALSTTIYEQILTENQ